MGLIQATFISTKLASSCQSKGVQTNLPYNFTLEAFTKYQKNMTAHFFQFPGSVLIDLHSGIRHKFFF